MPVTYPDDVACNFISERPRPGICLFFFFNDPATTEISPLPLHDALPISIAAADDVPGTHTTLRIWQHRPPMAWTPQTDRMAALVADAATVMGTQIPTIPTLGASDAKIGRAHV